MFVFHLDGGRGTDSLVKRCKLEATGAFYLSEMVMSGFCDTEVGHFSLARLGDRDGHVSPADPELLARAVRAHKEGDAVAQALLTLALVLAIGAVAVVLSVGHAAAASQIIVSSVWDNSAVLIALAGLGSALLLIHRTTSRLAAARIANRSHATRPRSR